MHSFPPLIRKGTIIDSTQTTPKAHVTVTARRSLDKRCQKLECTAASLDRICLAWSGCWELLWRGSDNSVHESDSSNRYLSEDELRRCPLTHSWYKARSPLRHPTSPTPSMQGGPPRHVKHHEALALVAPAQQHRSFQIYWPELCTPVSRLHFCMVCRCVLCDVQSAEGTPSVPRHGIAEASRTAARPELTPALGGWVGAKDIRDTMSLTKMPTQPQSTPRPSGDKALHHHPTTAKEQRDVTTAFTAPHQQTALINSEQLLPCR